MTKLHSDIKFIRDIGKDKHGNIMGEYLCHCGNTFISRNSYMRRGLQKSCGCINRKYDNPAFGQVYNEYRNNAKNRGYRFDLSIDFVKEATKRNCYYCGSEPINTAKSGRHVYVYNGLDRFDNNKGYVENNIVTCCKHCNISKRDRTHDEFLEWIKMVYNHSVLEVSDE